MAPSIIRGPQGPLATFRMNNGKGTGQTLPLVFVHADPGRATHRATYFARCWPNSETTQGFEFIHLVRDGKRVFVTYEARGAGGHRFRNTEIVTVRGKQIAEVEVYFGWDLPHKAPVGGFVDEA